MSDANQTPGNGPVAPSSPGGQPNQTNDRLQTPATNDDAIEGTDIVEVQGIDKGVDIRDPQRMHQEAAKQLAIIFAAILAGGLLLHYISLTSLSLFGFTEGVKELNTFFNIWLPVVSSIVTAVATYYFTRPKD